MIAAKHFESRSIERAYDRRRWIYAKTMAVLEWAYHETALKQANIRSGERVLEVAVGPGLSMLEIARQVGKATTVSGVDLSQGMLEMTRNRLVKACYTNVDLRHADARKLPFESQRFDLLYNAYMLDIVPLEDMPIILSEFMRVLRPGGRLVLLNMSKQNEQSADVRERLYRFLPSVLTLYLQGGCRPVLMEQSARDIGFRQVRRTFMPGRMPSELVTAVR